MNIAGRARNGRVLPTCQRSLERTQKMANTNLGPVQAPVLSEDDARRLEKRLGERAQLAHIMALRPHK